MVDGKLNRQVCKGMLEALLYHIMYQPGLTQQTLVEHYKDVLQPLAVLDLVQVNRNTLSCIGLHFILRSSLDQHIQTSSQVITFIWSFICNFP